ncbi:hypothetical protein HYFRA_00013735 [Hymenoscyphus fraxineus]|uniref:UBC core domain-containing protein n=1 Tax=Hymenoscyphus fraxineus TaxID=746836 RepID=A0A9N9Q002_9HELO|nr:hypothetical protein HYFRA_00013735 [Hymenoscyphus fraxineus]
MVPPKLPTLSAVRRQHILVEFSSLKHACPHGVFMSLTPGDVTLWSGVLFIRKGPYAPAILRFQISFPPSYPSLPPLVTFSTDIFHPLITPLTTYMYTTDIQDSGTVSATDEERLPPGGFSLRHGFPAWFGRASRRSVERNRSDSLQTPRKANSGVESPGSILSGRSSSPTVGQNTGGSRSTASEPGRRDITTYEVLRYIRSSFDDDQIMDDIPLEAAGNPGAWHAWRTHRAKLAMTAATEAGSTSTTNQGNLMSPRITSPTAARKAGDWNWDGVWEIRVKKGVEASVSEAVLYGTSTGDDLIQFLHMDEDQIEKIKENVQRSLETVEPQRRGIV